MTLRYVTLVLRDYIDYTVLKIKYPHLKMLRWNSKHNSCIKSKLLRYMKTGYNNIAYDVVKTQRTHTYCQILCVGW